MKFQIDQKSKPHYMRKPKIAHSISSQRIISVKNIKKRTNKKMN